jgi:hypothetical protein
MPRRKKAKKKKKSMGGARFNPGDRAGGLSIVRALPFPDRLQVRMKLNQVIEITDPDSFTDTVVSGNSLFDPMASIGSAQPPFYDQLNLVYRNYVVLSSKVSIRVMMITVTSDRQYRCGITPRQQSTAFSTNSDLLAQPYSKHRDSSVPGPMVPLVNSITTSKFLGLRDVYQPVAESTANVTCVADVSANPTCEWFWHIGCQTPTVGTDIKAQMDFSVEFEAEFFGREGVGIALDRALEMKRKRDEYLSLKAKTPAKDGRVPRPPPIDALKVYVESLERKEGKEPSMGWVLAKTPTAKR